MVGTKATEATVIDTISWTGKWASDISSFRPNSWYGVQSTKKDHDVQWTRTEAFRSYKNRTRESRRWWTPAQIKRTNLGIPTNCCWHVQNHPAELRIGPSTGIRFGNTCSVALFVTKVTAAWSDHSMRQEWSATQRLCIGYVEWLRKHGLYERFRESDYVEFESSRSSRRLSCVVSLVQLVISCLICMLPFATCQ